MCLPPIGRKTHYDFNPRVASSRKRFIEPQLRLEPSNKKRNERPAGGLYKPSDVEHEDVGDRIGKQLL